MRVLLQLFWEFLRLSLFVIGGGYAIIAVADDACARRGWTAEGELLDRLPIFQSIPGLIAAHSAVYVGNKVAGGLGAAVAVVAVALPSVVVFSLVAVGYRSLPLDNALVKSAFVGLRAALAGIVAAALLRGWRRSLPDAFSFLLAAAATLAIGALGVSAVLVLVAAMAAGLASQASGGGAAAGRRTFRSSPLALLVFLKYGLVGFGGGFALVPLYVADFVGPAAAYLQVSAEDFANVMALSQMTPGPIGVNCATFFGYRLCGLPGAVAASALLLLPGAAICFVAVRSLARFGDSRIVSGIMRGARPASVALMLCALRIFAANIWYNVTAILIAMATTVLIMKKKANAVLLIVLSAFAALVLRADEPVTSARFPDADAVIVDETERVRYNPDGTYESIEERWTKILTEKGRRDESTLRLDYSRRYGEAEIAFVRAVGEDGREREIDVSATTKESTDNGLMASNIYDPLDRQIVCTIPGLKVGDTLHVKMRRTAKKPRCRDKWADLSVMEWKVPIVRGVYEVTAPPDRPLKRILVRNPLGNVVTNATRLADGSIVHTFTVTNSPQAFPEPDMPPLYTQVQHVRVSTAADWPEISRWYWDLCAPHLVKTNAAMCAKAAELGRDLRAIFKFVSQEVRYMGLTMEDTSPGYAPHDVDITFDNRYGVCRDKAALLVAMLRLAGFKAYPVLIHVGAKLDPDVPQPFFNHAIVAVEAEASGSEMEKAERGSEDGRYVLMDPTNENAKDIFPAYLCNRSYLVCCPDGERLKTSAIPPPGRNLLEVESSGSVSKDGALFLESEIRFAGINDTAYRGALVRRQPGDRVKFFEKIVRAIAPGAELVRCDIEPKDMRDTDSPVVVRMAANVPEAVMRGETQSVLNVPFLSGALGMANFLLSGNTSLAQRRYPLVLDTTARVSERVRIDLGDSVGAAIELPDDSVGKPSGCLFERSFAVTNGELSAVRSFSVGAVEFSPAAYAELREDIKRIEAASRRKPVFAGNPLREADSRCMLCSTETTVFSDRAWTTTNTMVREVLTYAGKKKFAELKFSFNPAVETVELLHASISNRNGEVRLVSDREKNVMDCGWAAAAPRYPAGKLLVVNLPAVEIGSVISYTTVRTVTNAPAAFYAEYGFDSTEPLDRRVVRVNGWRREVTGPHRVPKESDQPDAAFWRDVVIVSSNRFGRLDLAIGQLDPAKAIGEAAADGGAESRIRAIRDWMAKYVKVAGPGLWDLPVGLQLTPPETVLRERYATRLDYLRTLCSLLRGAGFEADVVFASSDADEPEAVRRRIMFEKPNVRVFSSALCRVTLREGGFLCFGGKERTFFLGTETQYSPLGPSSYAGSDYFDPATGGFGIVTVPDPKFERSTSETSEYDVRENGSVDLTVVNEIAGPGVGAFRKRYSEILPEERSRRYQEILGNVAQAATATGDLETDVESYPARMKFSCFIPDFATVQGDAITIQLPPLSSSIPSAAGSVRQTPFEVGACDPEEELVTVKFPDGFGKLEHLPSPFVFSDPSDPGKVWMESEVSSAKGEDGRLAVTIRRKVLKRGESWYRPEFHELVKDWRRIATSRGNRTITVRRLKDK
ncbi:MAG: chromate transporter [Kiritimatiellae bacterium]|nr:chromate transporter [Kiritimatiellia bacterium]